MLSKKLLVGAAVSLVFVGGMYADTLLGLDVCLLALFLLFVPLMVREFYTLCASGGLTPFPRFGIVMCEVLLVLRWLGYPGVLERIWPSVAATAGWAHLRPLVHPAGWAIAIFGALWLQATKRDNAATFESISTTLFGLLYTVFLGGFLLDLRHLGAGGVLGGAAWPARGAALAVVTASAVKLCDVGAFAFGSLWGRHVMIQRISPKKTYEGAAGGLLFSCATALIFYVAGCFPVEYWWQALLFGIVVAVFGMYGDLAESLLKRGARKKDAGALVPGFGGVLDLFDSLLVAAPAAFLMLLWMAE